MAVRDRRYFEVKVFADERVPAVSAAHGACHEDLVDGFQEIFCFNPDDTVAGVGAGKGVSHRLSMSRFHISPFFSFALAGGPVDSDRL